jgi:NAD(P)-dependent dehydrogenase (short-subunit alcohol dehydrogenase family)
MRLGGKVALVTGGATGIGRAIALRFAREGASVVVADVSVAGGEATARDTGGRFVPCDVASPDQVKAAVTEAVAAFGGLDIVVACAADLGSAHDVTSMPEEQWRRELAVTLDGVFHAAKYAAPEMERRGSGSIVIISSVEGMTGTTDHVAYITGKSALFGLTRSMAIDLGKRGIRVNAISPGPIDAGRPDQERLKHNPNVMRFWREMTVLDRMGRPDEVAAAALFLASDEASYITGHNLVVDGGWTIGHPPIDWGT